MSVLGFSSVSMSSVLLIDGLTQAISLWSVCHLEHEESSRDKEIHFLLRPMSVAFSGRTPAGKRSVSV